jgi:hypothetical protein
LKLFTVFLSFNFVMISLYQYLLKSMEKGNDA